MIFGFGEDGSEFIDKNMVVEVEVEVGVDVDVDVDIDINVDDNKVYIRLPACPLVDCRIAGFYCCPDKYFLELANLITGQSGKSYSLDGR